MNFRYKFSYINDVRYTLSPNSYLAPAHLPGRSGVPLTGVLETGAFARPENVLPGWKNPGLVIHKHKSSPERKAHFHDSENPRLQNPC